MNSLRRYISCPIGGAIKEPATLNLIGSGYQICFILTYQAKMEVLSLNFRLSTNIFKLPTNKAYFHNDWLPFKWAEKM